MKPCPNNSPVMTLFPTLVPINLAIPSPAPSVVDLPSKTPNNLALPIDTAEDSPEPLKIPNNRALPIGLAIDVAIPNIPVKERKPRPNEIKVGKDVP